MMSEKEVINNLQKDIVIPDVVRIKAEWAFEQIKEEGGQKNMVSGRKIKWKAVRVAVAAATLAFGSVTVGAAAYINWSKSLEAEFHATEEQKQFLAEQELVTPHTDSVTDGGVTVSLQQSIVDNWFAHLSFKVEGYDLEEGAEPCFENISVSIDGNSDLSWSGSFFNGLTSDENGNPVYADGTPLKEDGDGSIQEIFAAEDGSMEFEITLSANGEAGYFIDAPLHIEFGNLGTVHKAEYFPDLEGNWAFDFTLQGSDEVKELAMSEALGDSGSTIIGAQISPISIQVTYEAPVEMETVEGVDENGQKVESHQYKEPPAFTGVRLKDGTMLKFICNGGSEGFTDLEKGIYTGTFAIDRILDTSQVDALLFIKSYPTGEGGITEENLYIVPID